MEIDQTTESAFIIGAVARATGIPVETLRVWERRYHVVTPQRDPGNKRHYSTEDIERLKLIKKLVDLGHSIGSIAALSDTALRERLGVHGDGADGPTRVQGRRVSVMVCGEMLSQMVRDWDLTDMALEVIGSYDSVPDFESGACNKRPQLLVIESPFLALEGLEKLADLVARVAARRGIVVYGYGPASVVEYGRKLGLRLIRGPLTAAAFGELCQAAESPPSRDDGPDSRHATAIPSPRFDSATLAKIVNISTSIRCECPQHLADLVFRIHAFERYSADCQNRNEQDAAIHASLKVCAGKARALFEDALAQVIEAEGLNVWLEEAAEKAGDENS